ncbi:MAG: hypothetical protein R2880_04770 [Deinococcales bacterium]
MDASGHSSSVESVSFSPDGLILASGSWDNTVKLWEVSSGKGATDASGAQQLGKECEF